MLTEFSNQLADIVAAVSQSVVQVEGGRRAASGLSYADGVVITTTKALERENALHVRQHDGRAADAELAGWDPATGIAVLRTTSLEAPALSPSSTPVRVGHVGVAIARSWSNAVTASAGVVAVIGGPLRTGRKRRIDQIFRTTAPMHDGFAGGAFLDAAGGLIGVATASSIRGLGVVIPARIAWKAAAMVLEHGGLKRGYLGIAGHRVSLTAHQLKVGGRERGLLLVGVTPDGPAARAGLLVGDVMLSVDATSIDTPEELMDLLMAREPGNVIKVQVIRGAALVDVAVTLGQRPAK